MDGSDDGEDMIEKLAHLSTTCPYYRALMQMFDFEAWVNARAMAKG